MQNFKNAEIKEVALYVKENGAKIVKRLNIEKSGSYNTFYGGYRLYNVVNETSKAFQLEIEYWQRTYKTTIITPKRVWIPKSVTSKMKKYYITNEGLSMWEGFAKFPKWFLNKNGLN